MTAPRLLLVTDPARARLPLLDLVSEAVAGGADAIYLRHLTADDDWAATLAEIRERVPPEVSLMVPGEPPQGIPGVGRHLRERDPLPEPLPPGASFPLSRSVHSPAEAARSCRVSYVVAGHVFPSASKPGREPLGLDGLARIAAAAPVPLVAIGGITPERVAGVMAAGAQGAAVIGAICEALDPRAVARDLRAAVDAARSCHVKGPEMNSTPISETTIAIMVNGKPREIPAGATVHDLLASRKLADSMAIVERNGVILPRDSYATAILAADDQLEIVHAVGGG
ncbi:MAG: sulfur carrier protein ThiS [Chloroflexota bacterium]|nr:sulfur carrier protein ThiS [Chloroflexota bacterium]